MDTGSRRHFPDTVSVSNFCVLLSAYSTCIRSWNVEMHNFPIWILSKFCVLSAIEFVLQKIQWQWSLQSFNQLWSAANISLRLHASGSNREFAIVHNKQQVRIIPFMFKFKGLKDWQFQFRFSLNFAWMRILWTNRIMFKKTLHSIRMTDLCLKPIKFIVYLVVSPQHKFLKFIFWWSLIPSIKAIFHETENCLL